MTAIGDRLKHRRIELGKTLEEVGKSIGLSKSTVHKYESGMIPNIPSDKIEKFAEALNCSPAYIMGWEPIKSTNKEDNVVSYKELIDTLPNLVEIKYKKRVPLLGRISAGMPILAVENLEGYEWTDNEMIDYALRVEGDSMTNARINDGDIVFVSRQCQIDNGDIVVALINGDDATVKRFYKYNDIIVLRPENPNLKEQEYPASEVELLGKVKEIKIKIC